MWPDASHSFTVGVGVIFRLKYFELLVGTPEIFSGQIKHIATPRVGT
jgi:hypothetical protein